MIRHMDFLLKRDGGYFSPSILRINDEKRTGVGEKGPRIMIYLNFSMDKTPYGDQSLNVWEWNCFPIHTLTQGFMGFLAAVAAASHFPPFSTQSSLTEKWSNLKSWESVPKTPSGLWSAIKVRYPCWMGGIGGAKVGVRKVNESGRNGGIFPSDKTFYDWRTHTWALGVCKNLVLLEWDHPVETRDMAIDAEYWNSYSSVIANFYKRCKLYREWVSFRK